MTEIQESPSKPFEIDNLVQMVDEKRKGKEVNDFFLSTLGEEEVVNPVL